MIERFSSYLNLLRFQPAVMFTVNQYSESISARIAAEKKRLQELVESMSIAEVYQLPALDSFEPDWQRVGERRSRK